MSGTIKEGITLKSLQTRLEKEKAELSVIGKQMNELKEKQKQHQQRMQSINKQLLELTKDKIIMTEHAKLRFLERVELISTEEIEKRVITDELIRMYKILGNGEFPIGIGEHTCIINNGAITTIK